MDCTIIRPRIQQMKKVVFIIILLFEVTMAAGQGANVDSLKNLLAETKDDTTRIMILSRLCNELARYEPDSAIQLAQEGLKQAKQIHFPKEEANLTMALGVALAYVGNYANAIKWLSSVLAYADTTTELEIKRRTYVELSLVYRDQGDYAEALNYITLSKSYLHHIARESCLVCRGGHGTGLGLSLAYDIVTKAHGGELKMQSEDGAGCEFIFLLPYSKNA
jgi:tetratricopeptide (TPR) repeat protein